MNEEARALDPRFTEGFFADPGTGLPFKFTEGSNERLPGSVPVGSPEGIAIGGGTNPIADLEQFNILKTGKTPQLESSGATVARGGPAGPRARTVQVATRAKTSAPRKVASKLGKNSLSTALALRGAGFEEGGQVDEAEQLAQAILGLISQKFQEGGQILPGTGQVLPNREIPQQVLGGLSQATRDEDPSAFTTLIDIIRKIIARQTKSEFVLDEPTAQTASRG